MSRIMELAQLYRLAGSASVDEHLSNLQAEVTRTEAKLATLETEKAEREKQEPTGWIVEALVDDEWIPQHPMYWSEQNAKEDKAIYSSGIQTRIGNLYLSAGAQPT